MKERPILFNAEMVKAILEGRKTQTRRIMRRQPDAVERYKRGEATSDTDAQFTILRCYKNPKGFRRCASGWSADAAYKTPFSEFNVGDRLWVRETWAHTSFPFDSFDPESDTAFFRADYIGDSFSENGDPDKSILGMKRKWIPSIHMPRAASRILVEIKKIRVERLNDISEADAKAEGFDYSTHPSAIKMGYAIGARTNFRTTWEQIYGPGTWGKNPWVWVVEFKVLEDPSL